MSNLVPEKRRDRNGRLVTRHVRTAQTAPQSAARVPAPAAPAKQAAAARWSFKLSPEQAERVEHSLTLHGTTPSEDLIGRQAWVEAAQGWKVYQFTASQAEMYDVISAVARPADALPLLVQGITTADDALTFLDGRGLSGLTANRNEFAEACLQRRVPAEDAFCADYKDDILLGSGSERGVADSIAFRLTPFGARMKNDIHGKLVLEDLGYGRISLDDIKAVGVTRLGKYGRLPALRGVFKQVHAEQGEWTTGAIRELLDRPDAESLRESSWQEIGFMCELHTPEQMATVRSLRFAATVSAFAWSKSGTGLGFSRERAARGAHYVSQLDSVAMSGGGWKDALPFFEEGIPAEVANEVILSGGDVAMARGIAAGAERGVASGWL